MGFRGRKLDKNTSKTQQAQKSNIYLKKKFSLILFGLMLISLLCLTVCLIYQNRGDERFFQIEIGILFVAFVTATVKIAYEFLFSSPNNQNLKNNLISNIANSKPFEIGFKTLIPAVIIASFLTFGAVYYFPLPNDGNTTDVLILRKEGRLGIGEFESKLLKVGSTHKEGYVLLNSVNIFFPRNDEIEVDSKTEALDLLEMTFWLWLAKRYNVHWEVDIDRFDAISGGQYVISPSKNSEENPMKLLPSQLQEHLYDNTYLVHEGQLWGITLPSGTSVNAIERTSSRRIFQIENKHIDFRIEIYKIGQSGLDYTTLGENIKKALESPDSWYSENFKVKFDCKYKKLFRGSPSTIKQKEWINELIKDFENDFEWDLIKPDLERAYSGNN